MSASTTPRNPLLSWSIYPRICDPVDVIIDAPLALSSSSLRTLRLKIKIKWQMGDARKGATGMNEVTEETQAFKNKLSSKGVYSENPKLFLTGLDLFLESQIAAQQNEILKQAAELAELKTTLNETLHKLNHEAARAVSLESTLAKCTEDLRNESLAAQNAAAALVGAQEKLRAKDLETRELEATLESLSHKSDTFNARGTKLEKEKITLEARVRELEGNLRQLSSPAPTAATPARQRVAARRRSSSVSDTKIITLEQDLKDTRASLAQRETELRGATAKLAQAQTDLVKVENEKLATDKRLHAEIRDLRAALQEKNEDLEYMQGQQGGDGREEELLKRIDEDEAKIAALEKLLADTPETQALKERLQRLDQKLLIESERVLEVEGRHIELVREKEEALDEVEEAQAQIAKLSDALRRKEAVIENLNAKQRQTAQPRPSVEEDIERLLGAVERIRGQRDDLRRDLHFVQTEAKFREEALEARIATLTAANENPPFIGDSQLQTELQVLQQQLSDARTHEQNMLHEKNREIRRIGLAAMASAVVIEHLQSQTGQAAEKQLLTESTAVEDACRRLKDVERQLGVAAQSLDAMTRQRNELLAQLALKESNWREELDTVRAAHEDAQDQLAQFDVRINDLSSSLYDVEAERNNLHLQVTNLSRDLEAAQQEIAEAETRYSALQFHQLSSMTSNEATQALRTQLAEQEARVLRKAERVEFLQHDSKRLETNLKLQEERLNEMTTELEVMAAQKDAMVEDCADARQARDAAIARVEDLEVELETLDGRLEDGDATLCALVGVVMETVNRSRQALWQLNEQGAMLTLRWINPSTGRLGHSQAEIERLANQLAEKDRLVSENDLEGELAQLKVKHVEEMGLLQGRLIEMTSALDEAQARCEAAEENYRQALSESTRSKQELESAAGDAAKQAEGLRVELARIRDEHAAAVGRLRDEVASAVSDAEKVQATHRILKPPPTYRRRTAQAREASGAPRTRVRARVQEKQELDAALDDAGNNGTCGVFLSTPKQELSDVATELAQARSETESLQEERTALQEEITTLQAEIQRSLSLRREQMIASLTSDLEHVRAQLARAEKTARPGGCNADLEERNNEMEELLKNKCAEIEENDDRALEMLKNNKKLTTKVESLTRKVQNLQAKLAAAKASNPSVPMEGLDSFLPSIAAPTPIRSNRVASGSALPRPKTPERKALPQVFRAQTPERRIVPIPPSPSAPVLGKKRRAPDDFEDVNVPTQGFTPECVPDENGTPRVRRVLNSLHSGFTPVRHSSSRAAVASPKRALPAARTSPYIADVTNSPRLGDTAKSKRSWLGKIRGTSQPRAPARTGDL
ncbi:hypothetical protein B0H13DRAFT_2279034 [Mycena leptocephala]|nr:hypothetical protein B0H13DRAFT_2279034 [Mycena leptocephala]